MEKQQLMEKLLTSAEELPSIPNIIVEVMEAANNDRSGADDIIKIIQYDQAITANCVKLCNSVYLGRAGREVKSLKDAVVVLGMKNLIKVVLASTAVKVFDAAHSGYGLRRGGLWRHSVGTAIASQLFTKAANLPESPTLFTAALLHDIGKLILNPYIEKESLAMLELIEQGFPEVEAESQLFGVSHTEVGAFLARHWRFPDILCEAIERHHTAFYSGEGNALFALVRLSNIVCKIACSKHDGIIIEIEEDLLSQFGIKSQEVRNIILAFPKEMKSATAFLNLEPE